MKNFFKNIFGKKDSSLARKEIQPVNKGAVVLGHSATSKYYSMYADALKCIDEMKVDAALDIYKKLVDLEDNKELALIGMGTCYNLKSDTNKIEYRDIALECYQKALAINDKSYMSLLGVASVYYKRKDYFTAILYYEKTKQINPQAADPYWGLAISNDLAGNIESAKANAKTFLAKASDTRYRDVMEKILAK